MGCHLLSIDWPLDRPCQSFQAQAKILTPSICPFLLQFAATSIRSQTPIKKRSRCTSLQESPFEKPPRDKYSVPPELDLNVKGLFHGTCAISGLNYSWGSRMVAGPGIETCHTIPKPMYLYHPDEFSDEEKWYAVKSSSNCKAMDSSCHIIYDNRLLAIQHVRFIQALFLGCCWLSKGTNRVRLFAPYTTCYDAKLPRSFLLDKCTKRCIVKVALQHDRDRKHVRSVVRWKRRSKPCLETEFASSLYDLLW